MSDPEGRTFDVASVTVNFDKVDLVISFAPLPEHLVLLIGHAVTIWNDFENRFNGYLAKLITANGSPIEDLERLRGKKLRKRFVDEVAAQFGKTSGISSFANRLRIDANRLGEKRNALVHGRLEFEFTGHPDGTEEHTIHAHAKNKTFKFNADSLDDLKHDLGGLSGRIGLFEEPIDAGDWLPSHERQRLRDFVGDSPLNRAILAMLQRPPQSSEA